MVLLEVCEYLLRMVWAVHGDVTSLVTKITRLLHGARPWATSASMAWVVAIGAAVFKASGVVVVVHDGRVVFLGCDGCLRDREGCVSFVVVGVLFIENIGVSSFCTKMI